MGGPITVVPAKSLLIFNNTLQACAMGKSAVSSTDILSGLFRTEYQSQAHKSEHRQEWLAHSASAMVQQEGTVQSEHSQQNRRKQSIVTYFAAIFFALLCTHSTNAQTIDELIKESRELESEHAYQLLLSGLSSGSGFEPNQTWILYNELSVVARNMGESSIALRYAKLANNRSIEENIRARTRAAVVVNLGLAAFDSRQFKMASHAFERAAALFREDPNSENETNAIFSLTQLANTRLMQGQPIEALSILERLEVRNDLINFLIAEANLELRRSKDAKVAASKIKKSNEKTQILQARILIQEGRLGSARRILEELLPRLPPRSHRLRASAFYNLAETYFIEGRFTEAYRLNEDAEIEYASAFPNKKHAARESPRHYSRGFTRHRRALIAQELGKFDDANRYYEEAIRIHKEYFGNGNHHFALASVIERSRLIALQGDAKGAAAILREPVARAGDPKNTYLSLIALSALGIAESKVPRIQEARSKLEQVIQIREQANFPKTDEPPTLVALAEVELLDRNFDLAEHYIDRAIGIQESFGIDAVDRLGDSYRVKAEILDKKGLRNAALALSKTNIARISKRVVELSKLTVSGFRFPRATRQQVIQFLDLTWSSSSGDPSLAEADAMFEAAQLLHVTETAQAERGVLRHIAESDSEAREVLDQRRALSRELAALRSSIALSGNQYDYNEDILSRKRFLENQISSLDKKLSIVSPELALAMSPRTFSAADLFDRIGHDEALWLQAIGDSHSYLFMLHDNSLRVERVEYGREEVKSIVDSLRASVRITSEGPPERFNNEASIEMFEAVLGPFEDILASTRQLLLVPDDAAQQISFALLSRISNIGDQDLGAGDPHISYLGLTHGLLTVPSIQGLVSKRLEGKRFDEGLFVGIGNPVLTGSSNCQSRGPSQLVETRSGLASPSLVRELCPLPDTEYELKWMAESLGPSKLLLAEEASEKVIKNIDLTSARYITFATHAVVAGEFGNFFEPALVLSPPTSASIEDDGMLTASEISALELNADLVILSACNTASTSGKSGAAGLSGLASSFFQAGARQLIVSHWTIDSRSSLLILPDFISELQNSDSIRPSEALRRSMVTAANIKHHNVDFSHPAYWAPFSLIGSERE